MMEGVMTKGTGRSMYSYDIGTQSVAGKTGTTNDNSDLWFMGYTPQILAGAWVGADDRYIRFTDNYFGQGAHGSLPIWAYFMNKVANDPACNLDRNASFLKPDNLSTDFNVNFVGRDSSIDLSIPDQDAEAIEAESDYSLISNNEPAVVTPTSSSPASNKPVVPKKSNTEPKQATTPANKPKAVMPKKKQ
jgi:penicillin-binding protein 1A